MTGFWFIVITVALVLALIGINLGRRPQMRLGQSQRRTTSEEEPDFPVEQPEMQDEVTDISGGPMPSVDTEFAAELGAEDWSALHDEIPLPANYGEDLVVVLVRNPRSLYVYWETGGGGLAELREMLGAEAFAQTIPCLRVFDLTDGRQFTDDVGENDDHWFIHGLEPNHRYIVSLERRTQGGRYYLLSLSDPIITPPDRPTAGGSLLYQRLERQAGGVISSWR